MTDLPEPSQRKTAVRLLAELFGTAALLLVVTGSGISADRLSGGNAAIALLCNASVIAAGLVVLIRCFGPLSGAHFNPLVTLSLWLSRHLSGRLAIGYCLCQLTGACLGVWITHYLFRLPIVEVSTHVRSGWPSLASEALAAFGLMATIFSGMRYERAHLPVLVGLYIFAACWFTSSACFVNPTVTLARSLTDTYVGIAPQSVPGFVVAQTCGGLAAWCLYRPYLSLPPPTTPAH